MHTRFVRRSVKVPFLSVRILGCFYFTSAFDHLPNLLAISRPNSCWTVLPVIIQSSVKFKDLTEALVRILRGMGTPMPSTDTCKPVRPNCFISIVLAFVCYWLHYSVRCACPGHFCGESVARQVLGYTVGGNPWGWHESAGHLTTYCEFRGGLKAVAYVITE